MKKKEYNKKTETGWIEEQYCLSGSYIDKDHYSNQLTIFLEENNVSIHISKKQLEILESLIKEFRRFVKLKEKTKNERNKI